MSSFGNFLANDIIRIGVVGYSDEDYIPNDLIAKKKIASGLGYFDLKDKEVHIVSGLTNMGIPRLAYELARDKGYKTVGITAEEAKKYELFPVDETFFVGEKFGDESDFFLKYINGLIKVGGGPQSKKEYESFRGPKVEFSLGL